MRAIVNVTQDWGIGAENHLLISVPSDLKRFRELTVGKTVILGRKTLETFPGKRPLKNRRNLILSRNPGFSAEKAEVFSSIRALLEAVKELPPEEVFVIGGESVYRALLPYCDRVLLTRTWFDGKADRFFPNLDALSQWRQDCASELMEENGVTFQYIDYVNRNATLLANSADEKRESVE